MESRKKDHINLAFQSQTTTNEQDTRFMYEPMLTGHQTRQIPTFTLAGKQMDVPIWISSMTGGTQMAGIINKNLARACHEFGMGMGLGSCRILLDDDTYFSDFDVRHILGNKVPLFTNFGISQLELMLQRNEIYKINKLTERLQADGIIIHVNPLQEWFQPEGDKIHKSPLACIEQLLQLTHYPVIVKEVGQGFGFESMKSLLALPLAAVEFAAFGGTNFAKVELLRAKGLRAELLEPLSKVGHNATDMTEMLNRIPLENIRTQSIIISGGIGNFLDGYYLIMKSKVPAVYGQASAFLKHAQANYEQLQEFVQLQIEGLKIAYNYLQIKE